MSEENEGVTGTEILLSGVVVVLIVVILVMGLISSMGSTTDIERAKCQHGAMHILYSNPDGSVGWYHTDVPCGEGEK
jgi:hypothetical protein